MLSQKGSQFFESERGGAEGASSVILVGLTILQNDNYDRFLMNI